MTNWREAQIVFNEGTLYLPISGIYLARDTPDTILSFKSRSNKELE